MSKRIWTQNEIDSIVYAFESGYTIKEIARKIRTRENNISKIIAETGHEIVKGRHNNRRLLHNYFEKIDSEEKAYFIGLLFTDGNVMLGDNGRSPIIRIELSEEDEEILHQLKYEIQSDASLTYNKRKDREKGTVSISLRSEKMAEDLAVFGIVPNKTYVTDRLPDNIPNEYMPAFLRGVIDGDGSIYYSGIGWHISLTTHFRSIAEDFECLCSKLIGKEKHLKPTLYNGVFKVTYNGKDASKLANICYSGATIGLLRKLRKAVSAMNDQKQVEDIV